MRLYKLGKGEKFGWVLCWGLFVPYQKFKNQMVIFEQP